MALHLHLDLSAPEDAPLLLAAEVIQAGGLIVYPTDTIYGIGANAWNPDAVKRVQEIKKRTETKPILVLVDSIESVNDVAGHITDLARELMASFWPGPLTLVMQASALLPRALTLDRGTVGIRVPASAPCRRLLALCGVPITSTSANLSGEKTPETAAAIEQALGPGIDLFLEGGVLPPSVPSTVVDVTGSRPRLIREGVISFEQLSAVSALIDR